VHVFVTVNTEVLPVAPIRRIVIVIPVFMMDGQLMAVGVIEFSPAMGAYQAVYGKRSLPVIGPGLRLLSDFHFADDIFRRPGGFRVDFDRAGTHPRSLGSEAHFRHDRAPQAFIFPNDRRKGMS